MTRFKRFLAALASILLLVFSMTTQASTTSAEWCEKQWSAESARACEQNPADYEGLLRNWKQYGSRCAGTVAYEARLATVYVFLKKYDQARATLAPLAQTRSEYGYLVEFAQLQIDYFAELVFGKASTEDVRRQENFFLNFVKKYPRFLDGYLILGGLQTMLDKHTEAIKSLETGLGSSMDTSGGYRNLTISYTALGRYQEAIRAADQAYARNTSLTSDQYFVYALAKANAGTGNTKSAVTILRVIVTKKPEVQYDPEFKEAVDFVKAKLSKN